MQPVVSIAASGKPLIDATLPAPRVLTSKDIGQLRKLHLYLIKPTQYDDDGYVVRHWRGVLPSNTLACLAGLTEDVVAQKRLGTRSR